MNKIINFELEKNENESKTAFHFNFWLLLIRNISEELLPVQREQRRLPQHQSRRQWSLPNRWSTDGRYPPCWTLMLSGWLWTLLNDLSRINRVSRIFLLTFPFFDLIAVCVKEILKRHFTCHRRWRAWWCVTTQQVSCVEMKNKYTSNRLRQVLWKNRNCKLIM